MSDLSIADVCKMKVVVLRKELKARGLPTTGDKAALVARLQTVITEETHADHGDIILDSDEIDFDGVLDKGGHDILDDTVHQINEIQILENQTQPGEEKVTESKLHRARKRRLNVSDSINNDDCVTKFGDTKESTHKKVVLNRAVSAALSNKTEAGNIEEVAPKIETPVESNKMEDPHCEINKVKISSNMDPKTRLELRAKRFGLPVSEMTEAQRKEARKFRFGQNIITASNLACSSSILSDNIVKLKKRADRFGLSVSKTMIDIEQKEILEKRKIKFGIL